MPGLIERRPNKPPRLGVVFAPAAISQEVGVRGLVVMDVQPGSPAERAGVMPSELSAESEIQLGDIVMSIGGHRVESIIDLRLYLQRHRSGDTTTLGVLRDGTPMRLPIEL